MPSAFARDRFEGLAAHCSYLDVAMVSGLPSASGPAILLLLHVNAPSELVERVLGRRRRRRREARRRGGRLEEGGFPLAPGA